MKQTITREVFHAAFRDLRPDNFSYDGLNSLFDYLEQIEQDTGKEIELDVIAICCDFAEGDVYDVAEAYNLDIPEDESNAFEIVYKFLCNKGVLVDTTKRDTFIYDQF